MVKKVARLFAKENSVKGASAILMVTLFFSNVLGVVRDHYLTQKIPTDLLSVYYAAFRIPDLIFNILILGAITSAFIPIFTTLNTQKKEKEGWMVANSVINLSIIVLVIASLILAGIMPLIVPLVVPGFSHDRQEMVINLARIMLASPILFGLSYIFGGILNSYKRFIAYSLAPLVYNLAIIAGTIILADRFSVTGVAVAVVIGAFLHFLIQLPTAISLGFKWQPTINFGHWGVKRIGILMLPRAVALGANQIMLLFFTAIASSIGGYAVAVYNLADNIQTMPMVVFGTSFATAIFPSLSESASSGGMENFRAQFKKTMRIILFFMIPITLIFILLRAQIVRLILGSGHFGWSQTVMTADTLAILALSLVFTGLTPLFSRAFYALHNTKIPMIVTIIGAIVSMVSGKLLAEAYGIKGLAFGFSIGGFLSAAVLYLTLKRKIDLGKEKDLLFYVAKILVASLLMAVAIQEVKSITGIFVDMQRFWGVATQTGLSLIIGLTIYLLLAWSFDCDEISAIKYVFRRLAKRGGGEQDESGSMAKQQFE